MQWPKGAVSWWHREEETPDAPTQCLGLNMTLDLPCGGSSEPQGRGSWGVSAFMAAAGRELRRPPSVKWNPE